jgi:hypothetical protein
VECQGRAPILRDQVCRKDTRFSNKCVEIAEMIEEPILDVRLIRLAKTKFVVLK